MFLSAHPADFYSADISCFGDLIENVLKIQVDPQKRGERKTVSVVAFLAFLNKRRTKKGSLMASFRLEQGKFDFIEAVAFEKTLNTLEDVEPQTMVKADFYVEAGFSEGERRYTIKSITSLEKVRLEKIKSIKLP